MITSSNFFNKNLFSDDFEQASANQDMGPWVDDNKPSRYATLDLRLKEDKSLNQSLIPIYHPIRNNRYIDRKQSSTGTSIEL